MKYPFSFRPLIAFPRPLKSPRKRARFDSSIDMTFSLLASELKAVKAKNAVLQLHIENGGLRADGLPKVALPSPEIVLSFETDTRAVSMPCDTYTDWRDNVRAIALSLESLRAVDRYGVTQNGEQYVGWAALPPAPEDVSDFVTQGDARAWLMSVSSASDPVAAYRYAAKVFHPDAPTGDAAKFRLLQKARKALNIP